MGAPEETHGLERCFDRTLAFLNDFGKLLLLLLLLLLFLRTSWSFPFIVDSPSCELFIHQ